MTNFNLKFVALTAISSMGLMAFNAGASQFKIGKESKLFKQMSTVHPGRQYKGDNVFSVDEARMKLDRNATEGPKKIAVKDPDFTYENLPAFGYIQSPDGNTWFYTSEFKTEEREIFIDDDLSYTDEVMTAFSFTIYDSTFTEVGKISDEIEYAPNETRAVALTLDPLMTRNFFNTDNNVEVMVYFAMNTQEYVNHYYYKVYSLGGETDEKGNNKAVTTLEGRIIDTTNASNTPGVEDYYFTFQSDAMSVDLDAEYDSYIDFLNSMIYRITVYTKATDDVNGIRELFTKDIYCARIPGDTTVGSYIIAKPFGGKMYYVFSQYKKPYFVDPTGMAQDESATPDNSLTIEVVSTTGNTPEQVSFTKIPIPTYEVPDQLIYTYMSIGSVAWENDIDMVVNGTPASPAFIVAVDVQNAAEYETFLSSGYYIYNTEGNIVKSLADVTNGMVLFSDGDTEPQAMYVITEGEGENMKYIFQFGGLYSGETHFTLDQDNNNDPISASCDRVKQKDGSYKYAFEMTYYETDSKDNDYIRVAWFNGDGTFDRIDRIKIGPNIMAAAVNMAASVLQPDLFDTDSKMEYAVLVKRSVGGIDDTTQGMTTEFMVVDDNGEEYAHFSEDDGKGLPYSFTISFGDVNRLMMIYNDNYRFNIDVFDLPFAFNDDPFEDSAVKDILDTNNSNIRYDGSSIVAENSTIVVYNSLGIQVARGNNVVSSANLANGTYIVVATDAQGKKSTIKIAR